MTRDDFEKISAHLVEKCKTICEIVMQEAKMNWSEIDKILLVGGMTRMPMVRQMIQEISDVPLDDQVSPDESVAVGAAIQGILSILADEDKTGEKTIPIETRQQFSTREGGLIQVSNITSHTLGVVLWNDNTLEEYVYPMIKKMTAMPAECKNNFGTAQANMAKVVVRVVEGESTVPGDCTPLGLCSVELPPYLPKGSPVSLSYQYNANQVLEVVVDAFGKQSRVNIERHTGLSDEEIAGATASLSMIHVE